MIQRCCYITVDFERLHHKTDLVYFSFPFMRTPMLFRRLQKTLVKSGRENKIIIWHISWISKQRFVMQPFRNPPLCTVAAPIQIYTARVTVRIRGLQRDVVYLGWPIAPSQMSPNAGGVRGLSQWVQVGTWSPNKLWRSNSIFNLWSEYFSFSFLALSPTFFTNVSQKILQDMLHLTIPQ
jgi:hypothetical protein